MKLPLIFGLLFCLMACQAKQESQEFAMQALNLEEQLDTTVIPVPIESSLPIELENPQQVTKGTAQKTAKPIERKIIRNANVNFTSLFAIH
jgi:hypothetical protein